MKISNEFKIGIMAIIVVSLTIWGYVFLRGRNILKAANDYYVRYENIEQLAVSSPVLIHGFQVGTVSSIRLDDDLKTIIATLDIDKGIRIPKDAEAVIISTSIMGGKAIDLRIEGVCQGDECAKPGSFIEGRVQGMIEGLFGSGEGSTMEQAKDKIGGILKTITDTLTSPDSQNEIAKTYTNLSALIRNLSSITNTLDKSMSEYDRHLQGSLRNIEAITGAFARNQDKIASAIQNMESISRQLEQAKLGETAQNANQLIVDAQTTMRELNEAVAEAQVSFKNLSDIMTDLQDGDGSLGKLLKDERLYNHALATTRNLELLLQDFRLNPKRYVNVSVFGKKQKEYTVPENDPAITPDQE